MPEIFSRDDFKKMSYDGETHNHIGPDDVPPFEPVEDDFARTHVLVNKVRGFVAYCESWGPVEPADLPALLPGIANLQILAELTAEAVARLRELVVEGRELEASDRRWQIEDAVRGLHRIAREVGA